MVSAVLTSIHLTSSDETRSTEVQRLVGVLKRRMSRVIRIPVGVSDQVRYQPSCTAS